jgi:hypothetical protein
MSDYYTEASLVINEALGNLDADLKGCTPSMLVSALEQHGYQIARLPTNPSQQERDSLDHSFYAALARRDSGVQP